LNAFGFKRLLQLRGNFGIFAGDKLFASVKDGDAAAEAAKHLPKFEANVTTSENEEVFGESGELHNGLVGEIGGGIEAGDGRYAWAAAGVDEDFLAF
jgi:hypothetical protein